jgi:hypothetical protein
LLLDLDVLTASAVPPPDASPDEDKAAPAGADDEDVCTAARLALVTVPTLALAETADAE